MAVSTADAAHLLRRSGFGVSSTALAELTPLSSRAAAVNKVLDLSKNPVAVSPVSTTAKTVDNFGAWKTMTYWWLDRMATSPTPIVEKMTLFWHGHFTSSLDSVGDMGVLAEQHMTIRKYALGDFHAFTQAMSINRGMLKYLDNWLNFVGKVQENFARELMELFTLGVGNYTQDDVVSMARAWTGHGFDLVNGGYKFTPEYHDNGMKVLFGQTRNWNGPAAVTEILKGTKAVASSKFIAAKLFSYFAYPVAPGDAVVTPLATTFRSSGLSIAALVKAIFNSTAFWSTTARAAQVRPPVEWFAASLKATGLPASKIPVVTIAQAGQMPFAPPDVSGWGSGTDWLSTSNMWGRTEWAAYARSLAYYAGVLAGVQNLTPAEMVQKAFDQFGITAPSASTRAALEAACEKTRSDGAGWVLPATLVQLVMISPEFQVA
jgi:uncharacterized protein (DUF1800 family)